MDLLDVHYIKGDGVHLKIIKKIIQIYNYQKKGNLLFLLIKLNLYRENKGKKPFYINCKEGEDINYEDIVGKEKLYNMFQKLIKF